MSPYDVINRQQERIHLLQKMLSCLIELINRKRTGINWLKIKLAIGVSHFFKNSFVRTRGLLTVILLKI